MVWHLFMIEDELGQRVGEGIGISADDVRGLAPLATQTLHRGGARARGEPRQQRHRATSSGLVMTHCVPNEHAAIAPEPSAGQRPVRALGRDGHRLAKWAGP